jgi:tRNA pseudouridine55 synthase
MTAPDAVVLVDKPAGPTSAAMVDWVKWALRAKAVGHCGTLDPAATGLLVVCVGAATKLASLLTDADKTYEARIALGRSTTTGDADGDVVEEMAVGEDVRARAASTLAGMIGELSLTPPAFSAVKVDGRRAHQAARVGEDPGLAPRRMIVRAANVLGDGEDLRVELRVSKGTYIRSLAVELGRRLSVPAHLAGLRRTQAGSFAVADALGPFSVAPIGADRRGKPRHRVRLEAVEGSREGQAAGIERGYIDPIDAVPLPRIDVADPEVWRRLGHGQPIEADHPALAEAPRSRRVAIVSKTSRALVLGAWEACGDGATLRPTRVVIAP